MSTSFIHDLSAQYMASVMFALTMLAAGAARAAWRRGGPGRRRARTATPTASDAAPGQPPDAGRDTHATAPPQDPGTSSGGRRKVSS
ncbi:hypothetical protein [Streptomyces sp. NPDC001508]|uniref:hypothetical protein n=1 Tax=Streptomyces sp. NPDC001508 TaxID=3154656 RepID=UPI00332A3684